jgi:hypothetical protein
MGTQKLLSRISAARLCVKTGIETECRSVPNITLVEFSLCSGLKRQI